MPSVVPDEVSFHLKPEDERQRLLTYENVRQAEEADEEQQKVDAIAGKLAQLLAPLLGVR